MPAFMSDVAVIIPLAGMAVGLLSLLIPVALVWVVLRFRQIRTERLYETIRHLADRGQPVPPELLDPPRRTRAGDTLRFRAITLIGAGLGLSLMFWLLDLRSIAGVGALLVCIGVAQLIALRLDRTSDSDSRVA